MVPGSILPLYALLPFLIVSGCASFSGEPYDAAADSLRFPGEKHLRNIRQLTFGGNNAEAYWSYDDEQLVFQSDWNRISPQDCDQIFVMNADGTPLTEGKPYDLVSTGRGRTTCGYFLPDGRVIYASTHAKAWACPRPVTFEAGRYVWPIYDSYDIYVTNPDTTLTKPDLLIGGPGYDAEATVSPNGRYVVFTSTRSGDLELWRYDRRTEELLQLTDAVGYDGGAFFSPNGRQIVWRASRPTGEDAETYKDLLKKGLVEPGVLNLFVADADGQNARQVTDLPGANWAPFFHPSGKKLLFTSNHHTLEAGGREFDLFMVDLDGGGLERITHSGTFDAFPMFSFDGERLAFASNRVASGTPSRDTNIFVADWVERPQLTDKNFRRAE